MLEGENLLKWRTIMFDNVNKVKNVSVALNPVKSFDGPNLDNVKTS